MSSSQNLPGRELHGQERDAALARVKGLIEPGHIITGVFERPTRGVMRFVNPVEYVVRWEPIPSEPAAKRDRKEHVRKDAALPVPVSEKVAVRETEEPDSIVVRLQPGGDLARRQRRDIDRIISSDEL